MMRKESFVWGATLLLVASLVAGCGSSSSEDIKAKVERGIQKMYDDWAAGNLAGDSDALAQLISSDYLNDGLTHSNRVAALASSVQAVNMTAYTITLQSLDEYTQTDATATGHFVYSYLWISGGCQVDRDTVSQGHFRSVDEGETWQTVGNQSASFRTPEVADLVTSTGYTADACLSFSDRVSGETSAFGSNDPAVYGLVHFTNLLGHFTGYREWIKPDGSLYIRVELDLSTSSDSYGGVTVGGALPIDGFGAFWQANEGEWTFRGEITGPTGTVTFSQPFTYTRTHQNRTASAGTASGELSAPGDAAVGEVSAN